MLYLSFSSNLTKASNQTHAKGAQKMIYTSRAITINMSKEFVNFKEFINIQFIWQLARIDPLYILFTCLVYFLRTCCRSVYTWSCIFTCKENIHNFATSLLLQNREVKLVEKKKLPLFEISQNYCWKAEEKKTKVLFIHFVITRLRWISEKA